MPHYRHSTARLTEQALDLTTDRTVARQPAIREDQELVYNEQGVVYLRTSDTVNVVDATPELVERGKGGGRPRSAVDGDRDGGEVARVRLEADAAGRDDRNGRTRGCRRQVELHLKGSGDTHLAGLGHLLVEGL
jgi:hypothetical protein